VTTAALLYFFCSCPEVNAINPSRHRRASFKEAEIVVLPGLKKRKRIALNIEKEEIKKHPQLFEEFFLACYKEQQE
jgi:hypothetical protein